MQRTLALLACTSAAAMKTVLVTGANKGIGKACCKRILRDHPDAKVLLGARSSALGDAAVQAILEEEPSAAGRIEMVQIDVTSDESVAAAAKAVEAKLGGARLHGVLNNAGVGFGRSIAETLATNLYGPKRVSEKFLPLVEAEGGRIVNVASASGPNFVTTLDGEQRELFVSRDTTWDQLQAACERYAACTDYEGIAYGLSKAALNVYTRLLAEEHPELRINACSPGYILTDLTKGMGASKRPDDSNCHVAPLFLLFGDPEGNGRYYGSDAVRSPIDRYRGPGEPPYAGD